MKNYDHLNFREKKAQYALIIVTFNEGERLLKQLANIQNVCPNIDIIIADAPSNDKSTEPDTLKKYDVRTLIRPHQFAGLSDVLGVAITFILRENYAGFVLMDGNNKDDPVFINDFLNKLREGYDYVQGSRFINPENSINTPARRTFMIQYIHAPIFSFACGQPYTDTTNGFRAFSSQFLHSPQMQCRLNKYTRYELPYMLAWVASHYKFKVIEIPVIRQYPKSGKIPTKIVGIRRHWDMIKPLLLATASKFIYRRAI